MLLLVQYIDSEFPDYDIVNKSRLLKIKHDKKNIKLVRSESDQTVHRAIVIQESEHEFRLKVVKDMLLKQHRAKRVAKKEWRNKTEEVVGSKRSSRVYYSSTDSDSDSETVRSNKSRQGLKVKNEIANSIGSSIHEPQSSSDSCVDFSGSPSTKSTSTPYPAAVNTSTSTVSHVECTDQEVQTRPDRMTKILDAIVSNGERAQEEVLKVLKMFEEFKKFPRSPESSPEIRRMRKRITNPKKSNSLDSQKNSDSHVQKKTIAENAERVCHNISKVLNMFSELDTYPEANLYKEKPDKYASSDEMISDATGASSNDDDSDYVAE